MKILKFQRRSPMLDFRSSRKNFDSPTLNFESVIILDQIITDIEFKVGESKFFYGMT